MSDPKPVTPISAERLARLDAEYAARYKSDKPSHWREAVAEDWPAIRARMAELEGQLQRAMDLVRFARHYLHGQNLITNEELGDLVFDTDCGNRVARLMTYDDMRKTIDQQAERIEKYQEGWRNQQATIESLNGRLSEQAQRIKELEQLGKLVLEGVAYITSGRDRAAVEIPAELQHDCLCLQEAIEGKP